MRKKIDDFIKIKFEDPILDIYITILVSNYDYLPDLSKLNVEYDDNRDLIHKFARELEKQHKCKVTVEEKDQDHFTIVLK